MKSVILITLIVLLGYTSKLSGQQYSFVALTVEDGLALNQVVDICSSDDGHLWFGTFGGVSKFDGHNFYNYTSRNGLLDNAVLQIENYNGYVWIATSNGITRIKGKEIKSLNLEKIRGEEPLIYFEFYNNELWMAVKNKGILRLQMKENFPDTSSLVIENLFPDVLGRVLLKDSKNRLWYGGKYYLGYYENGNWKTQIIPNSEMNISDIKEDHIGNIWIATFSDGVFKFDGLKYHQYSLEQGLLNSRPRNLLVDSKDRIWAACKEGVSVIENGNISIFNEKNGLRDATNIRSMAEDLEGNIWFGTSGSGVLRFTGGAFVNYTSESGLSSDGIMSITEDAKGNLYFSSHDHGLTILKKDSLQYFNQTNSDLNTTMWASLTDSKGKIWLGTSYGLATIEHNKLSIFKDKNWLLSNKVTAIFEDSRHRIWIGMPNGITVIDQDSIYTLGETDGLTGKNFRTFEEIDGSIWTGSSQGIFIIQDHKITPALFNAQLENPITYCIEKICDTIVYIGTAQGLFCYKSGIIEGIELHNSFSSNNINFLLLENNKYLWVGTNFGIFEINVNNFDPENGIGIWHYTRADGLKSVETNLNAAYIDHLGQVWMGTAKGLLKFNRKEKKDSEEEIIPKVAITNVQLFLKDTDWSKYCSKIDPYSELPQNLSVHYRKNHFTFYFKAVSLSRHKTLQYKIMLEGFDEDWYPLKNVESFAYANLPHGAYVFKVIASIDGKSWSMPASFGFKIKIPFFLTWWFFAICFICIILMFLAIWKWQLSIEKRKRLTENLMYKSKLLALEQQSLNASMNRHFIFNALNSIQYYINTQDKLSANRYLTSFAKLIRKNLDSSSSGDSLVPLTEELERLELYISLEHMRFQNKFKYDINIAQGVDSDKILVPGMFLQPFVENSIWHGILPKEKGGEIYINIFYTEKNSLVFEIVDNGIGIEVSLAQKTNHQHISKGMIITTGRVELLKKLIQKDIIITGPYQRNDSDGNALGTTVHIEIAQ